MAELLVTYTEPTRSATGDLYYARALGRAGDDGLWEGWLEFTRAGDDVTVPTRRETEQPNRADLIYWAEGLTQTYLEGALERALAPEPAPLQVEEPRQFVASEPRQSGVPAATLSNRVVLDPFVTYTEGEQLLRNQLRALSHDHLQNIVEAYRLVDAAEPDWARSAPKAALVERIVERVRARFNGTQRAPEEQARP